MLHYITLLYITSHYITLHYILTGRLIQDYGTKDIDIIRDAILDHWDVNHDGKISRSELRMLLLQQCRLAAEQDGIPFEDDDQPEVD